MPGIAFHAKLVAVVEQFAHVVGIEFLFVRIGEVGSDEREVEVHTVILRRGVDPVEIAEALVLEQGVDRPASVVAQSGLSIALRMM